MTNPVVQTDIAEILSEVRQELRGINDRLGRLEVGQAKIEGKIEAVDERLGGQIETLDQKLSGEIKNVDEKLSGQIKTLDEKVSGQKEAIDTKSDQLEKRISNQEFFNRVIGGSLVVSILGGIAGFFWMASKLQ
ncbi:hypothetical protein [Myxosarcina sp. GI1(2024)]